MSNRALNWAFDSNLPSGPRFVLVILGDAGSDHSGEDWTCFPSVERIVEMSGMGRSTVERHLSWLWAEGWISREPRVRADGTLGINDYVLHRRADTRERLKDERSAVDRKPGRRRAPSLKSRVGPSLKSRVGNPQIEGSETLKSRGQEPLSEPLIEPSMRAREPGDQGFEEAAALWPVKGQKFTRWPGARAAWAFACQSETPERLTAAVRSCANDPDRVKGDFGWPGLDVFLRDEIWRGYLPTSASAASQQGALRTEFVGPAEIRALAVQRMGAAWVESRLDRAGWDEAARAIVAPTGWISDQLRQLERDFQKLGASVAPPQIIRGN